MEAAKDALSWLGKELGMSDQSTPLSDAPASDAPPPAAPEIPVAPAPAADPTAAAGVLHEAFAKLASAHQAASDLISAATAEVQAAITAAEAAGLKVEHKLDELGGEIVTDVSEFGLTIWQKL